MIYRLIASIYPKKIQKEVTQLLRYCDIKTPLERYLTFVFFGSIIVSIVTSFIIKIFIDLPLIIYFILGFFLFQGIMYSTLSLRADSRAQFIEELLPDALQLMASNLRAGLTVDRALLLSARPEFGRFKDDLNRVGKEIATGKKLSEALLGLSARVRSEKLKKTFQLIVSGLASGGQLADLLQETAGNLRQQKLIDSRIRSSVLVYVIFIFSAIAFGAPMLFALSSFLIEVITDIFSKVTFPETSAAVQIPISFSQVGISPEFVNSFTIGSLLITVFLGSLILGLISKGKEREGLKFLPLLFIITFVVYFIVKAGIRLLLGGLFDI